MNTCMTITCLTCMEDVDCRLGYSNREVQPIQFACPHCESRVQIVLDISEAPRSIFSFSGCERSLRETGVLFDGSNPFVDLHLDFPVRRGKYVPGNTPWFQSMQEMEDAGMSPDEVMAAQAFHSRRLDLLNAYYPLADKLRSVINLYFSKNKQLFQQRAAELLGEPVRSSILQQDLNATVYSVVTRAFLPFVIFEQSVEISTQLPRLLSTFEPAALDGFVDEMFSDGYILSLQQDCLKLYPRIFAAEIALRPALFLDFFKKDAADQLISGRVSSHDFSEFKDLYKDILEIMSRQLVIIAGINNIYHRGDSNGFKPIGGAALSGLKKLSEKNLSDRFKYLDDCWYTLSEGAFNLGLRNAIAHNNVSYDDLAQVITYVPNGGGLAPVDAEEMHFLEFIRLLLEAFREMNNMGHVLKSVYYYKLLIRDQK